MKCLLLNFIIIIYLMRESSAFSSGAPLTACESVTPRHFDFLPQTAPTPFEVRPLALVVGQGQKLYVEIKTTNPEIPFQGFMVQAINNVGTIIGQFTAQPNLVNLRDCTTPGSTATHANADPKNSVILEWLVPENILLTFQFRATVLQSIPIFWVSLLTANVQIVPVNQAPITTTTTSTTTTTTTTTKAPESDVIDVYEGCAITKTCFGFPDGCVGTRNCISFGSITFRNGRFFYELQSSIGAAYIALALSEDNLMGQDSVIECVNESGNGPITAHTSFTSSDRSGSPRTGIPQTIITTLLTRFEDGRIYCLVERDPLTRVNDVTFDMINDRFFLLIASGTTLRINEVGAHDINFASSGSALLLTTPSVVTFRSRVLLQLHGSFMIVAWVGTASIGIFMSRYFKKTWVGSKACGKDHWFVWHLLCMITTVILTIAAYVIIFIDVGDFHASYHSIIGSVSFALALLQPIAGVFRPDVTKTSRPIFNWLHFCLGNITHVLAIITIFFGLSMNRSAVPEWLHFILIGYVVFYIAMHVIFTTVNISGEIATKSSSKLHQRTNKDEPYSLLRKTLFGFFVLTILILVIALVIITVLSPF